MNPLEWVFPATASIAGLFVGSFLNVVVHRGPTLWGLVGGGPSRERGDFITPRSYCPSCRSPIARRNLIPVLSYLLQRGRCRQCCAPIALSYPIVEVLSALGAATAVFAYGATISALFAAAAVFFLIAIAEVDRRTRYIPDALSQPLLWTGLLSNINGRFSSLPDAVLGAIAGFVSLSLVAAGYRQLRGREGLGEGDAVLLAAIGAWVGWRELPLVVFGAAAATLAVVAAKAMRARNWNSEMEIPFGPGLAATGALAILLADAPRPWLD